MILVYAAFFGASILAAGFSLGDALPQSASGGWGLFTPSAVDELATAGLAATLVVLLVRNRGISMREFGLDVPRDDRGRWARGATLRLMTWAVVAFVGGSLVTGVLATGQFNLPIQLNAAFFVYAGTSALNAGIVEEAVALGFVVATLRQARRPIWEIFAVALVLRSAYHIYYGVGVVGILVWASVFIWLYLRTRSLLPLMAVHFVWDFTLFFGDRWHGVLAVAAFVVLAMVIASPITWLIERAEPHGTDAGWRPAMAWSGAQPAQPPGWHPDPWNRAQWRWWDGVRWSASTAPPGGSAAPTPTPTGVTPPAPDQPSLR